MTEEISTPRLTLRPPCMEDVPAITSGIGNYNVARFLSRVPYPYSEDDARHWLSGLPVNRPEFAIFVIENKDSDLIGVISIESELGYWLAEAHWGVGYATEAGRAVLDWHFANTDAESVKSAAHYDNPASLNVQRKLGFRVTGEEKRFAVSRGEDVLHIDTLLTRAAFEGKGALS